MLVKENQIIKANELAKLLGITDRHLRNLASEGIIKKTEKGKYLFWENVLGYIEYIETKNDVDLNLKDEKIKEEIKRIKKDVELKDLKIKETKNQLHLASIVEKVMTDMLMNIKGKLLSISSKVAPAVIAADNLGEIQDVIQDEIFEVLEELSEYDPDMFKNNKIFIENEEAILNGNFHQSLLKLSKYRHQITDVIDCSVEHIYQSDEVVEKEVQGYVILQHLLDIFFTAIINFENGRETSFDKLLLKKLPEKYQKKGSIYDKVMGITCYIASLTDSKAVELHLKTASSAKNI